MYPSERAQFLSGIVIAKNALYNVLAFLVTLAVNFFLIPVMLYYLGATGFGVWAIVRVFISYASLSDFGLSSTVTKYVAELTAKQDTNKLARILQSAFFLYGIAAFVIVVLVWLFDQALITTFFPDSGAFASDVRFVLLGSLIIFAVNLIGSVFSSALNGLQRMDITNGVTAVYWLVNGLLMYLALAAGYGLRGLVAANAVSVGIMILLNGFFFLRLFGSQLLVRFTLSFAEIRESYRYSKEIFIIAIANSVHLHYDKLLVSSFLNLGAVTNYEIASRIIQLMRQLAVLVLNPILPVASDLHAQERTESIQRLYQRSLKYLIVFCLPMFACAGAFGSEFIALWLGESAPMVVLTLQLLLIPNFVNLMTGPAYFISIAIGKIALGRTSALIGLALNLVLSYLFLQQYGYVGLLIGTTLALLCEAGLFFYLFHKTLNIRWQYFFRLFFHPAVAIAAGIGVGFTTGFAIDALLAKTIIMLLVTIAIYTVVLWRQRYFDGEDWAFFREVRSKIVARFTAVEQQL